MVGDATSDCTKCGAPRVWRKRVNPKGWHRYCKVCNYAYLKRLKERAYSRIRERVAQRRVDDPVFRATMIWRGARTRARHKGLDFSVELSTVISGVLTGECAITGIPFDFSRQSRHSNSFSPSIDRIDSKKGYIEGNVQIVCWIYNRAKSAGTHDDVLRLAEAIMIKRGSDRHPRNHSEFLKLGAD